MLFNSFHFAVYFAVVTALYFALGQRWRWSMLLVASCYFYMVFRPVYILILAFTILVDYVAGLRIEAAEGIARKRWLVASIIANVAVLAVFKYWNFLNNSLTEFLGLGQLANPIPGLDLLLPIGLSFHTFQSLSYTIEVYRGRQAAERNPGVFALYVMFYPQLVAGPIERPQNLLHQFREFHAFDYVRIVSGLQLMTWGLVKKVVVADRLSPFVAAVYADPHGFPGISYLVATFFFAFQIYCDFSGYSDVALGTAQVMGFTLMRNFERPYFSQSIAEFWKRWHISLSTWFRDYLYISLGGNRVSPSRVKVNLMLTFLVSGLWHGANWTYVIWGGLNGFYLVVEQLLGRGRERVEAVGVRGAARALAAVAVTFTLTCIAWVFFRATSVGDAVHILRHAADGLTTLPHDLLDRGFVKRFVFLRQDKLEFAMAFAAIAGVVLVDYLERGSGLRERIRARPAWVRWPVYIGAVGAILYFGAFNSAQDFIYFQF